MYFQFILFGFLTTACKDSTKTVLETETETVVADADGDGFAAGEDCNDFDASINPGMSELCDNLDNNCNGEIDEEVTSVYYLDADGDGFGDADAAEESCEISNRYVSNGNDCNDTDASIYPSAPELCDNVDNDCNGLVDDDLGTLWYEDTDFDGYGNPDAAVEGCMPGVGFVDNAQDCDDTEYLINPSQAEICDELDNDCNNLIDDGVVQTYYEDADGDGFGNPSASIQSCNIVAGYIEDSTDCDDTNAAVYPGGIDNSPFDGIDADCDGVDGDHDDAIHVSLAHGSDANDGSLDSPLLSIAEGLSQASAQGKTYVLVAEGSYTENITLPDGVILYGSMSESFDSRSVNPPTTSIVGAGGTPAVIAQNISQGAQIDGFYIEGHPSNSQSSSAIGVYISDSTDALILTDNVIYSADAKDGLDGAVGGDGNTGNSGEDGATGGLNDCSGSLYAGGLGAAGVCGSQDVAGGDGADTTCPVHLQDQPTGDDGLGDDPGIAGTGGCDAVLNNSAIGCVCNIVSDTCYGTGNIGLDGGFGTDGTGGTGSTSTGYFSGMNWTVIDGVAGIDATHGSGGGGGGAGSGAFRNSNVCGAFNHVGGTGGGGGAGGCGGSGGAAGSSGGSSFGVVFSCTTSCATLPYLSGNEITSGDGGSGGDGGDGGLGGLGGEGGLAGPSDKTTAWCSYDGGAGGDGGNGGDGGGGGGGAGGNSYAIYVVNVVPDTAWVSTENDLDAGLAGLGGRGGRGGSQSNDGEDGVNGDYDEQNW